MNQPGCKPTIQLTLGCLVVFIYVSPWFLFGESSFIRIHDNLDGLLPQYVALAQGGFWFEPNLSLVGPILPQTLSRVSYPSEIAATTPLFSFLEPFWAYVIYQLVFRLLAFAGLWFFLNATLKLDLPNRVFIIIGVSICFACLPFFAWAAGPAVMPWIAYAVIKAWRREIGPLAIGAILIAPLFSSFQLTGIFIVGSLFLVAIAAFYYSKMSWQLAGVIVTLIIIHLATGYRLIAFVLSEGFETNRKDIVFGTPFAVAYESFLYNFTNGNAHAPSLHWAIIAPTLCIALSIWLIPKLARYSVPTFKTSKAKHYIIVAIVLFFAASLIGLTPEFSGRLYLFTKEIWETAASVYFYAGVIVLGITLSVFVWNRLYKTQRKHTETKLFFDQEDFLLIALPIFIFMISILHGLWLWSALDSIRENVPVIGELNLSRIVFFQPFLWALVFAISLIFISRIKHAQILLGIIIALQFFHTIRQHEYITEQRYTGVNFQSYMAERLFDRIEKAIDAPKNSYIIASIGLHPSIAQYNGFQTADAYLSLYPYNYKKKFRKAVVDEFSRREDLLSYFDDWGNRAYFFSSEVLCPRNGSLCLKDQSYQIKEYRMNMDAVGDLNVDYFFSISDIGNAEELGLVDLGRFEDKTSAWSIRIYKVADDRLPVEN